MKHRAFAPVEVIVVVLIIAVLTAILYPVIAPRPPHGSYRSVCQSNLKQIGFAFMQYADENGERFPSVDGAGGWAKALQPYARSWAIFQCPTDKTSAPETTDYFINARAANMKLEDFEDRSLSILAGEGASDQTPNINIKQLPDAWRKNSKSPAKRHLDGANTLFADGRVKWLKPEKITFDKPSVNHPTFLLGRSQ